MSRRAGWLVLLAGSGCAAPSEGTFIGNPELTAEIAPSDAQFARAGQLAASDVALRPCDGDPRSVGAFTWEFVGFRSADRLQIPAGDWCGLTLEVEELALVFDDGADAAREVSAAGLTVSVDGDLSVDGGESLAFRLGDPGWLDRLAEVLPVGQTEIADAEPAAQDAFFGGLDASGAGPSAPPTAPGDPLPGRLNLEGYPESPLGTPTSTTGCGPNTTFHLAVPVPHAAMAAQGLVADGTVGWCEGEVTFPDPLVDLTAIQTDYSDLSTWEVTYQGWGTACGQLHCAQVLDASGQALGRPCSVLAACDLASGEAVVAGFAW